MEDSILSRNQVAEFLKVSNSTVLKWIHQGVLEPDFYFETSTNNLPRPKFKRGSVIAFIEKYSTSAYTGEKLYSVAEIAKMLGVTTHALNHYIEIDLLVPDVSYPSCSGQRVGFRKFKLSTVDAFVADVLAGKPSPRGHKLKFRVHSAKAFRDYVEKRGVLNV